MKARIVFSLMLAVAAPLALAQSKPPAQEQSAGQQALGWLQQQWKRVEDSGRPMAERIVREFPARFKDMEAQVANATASVAKYSQNFSDDHHLDQKKTLLLELWRVRGSLNLLSLLSPEMLHQLTGMDTKTLQSLQNQVAAARQKLGV